MESKVAVDQKFSPRRDFRFSRSERNQKAFASNILEAIAQFSGGKMAESEDGRMKFVVKKEDLKQVLEVIRDRRILGRRTAAPPEALPLEQRLNLLRRRQILRAGSQVKCRSQLRTWRPALQSIPEEL